MTRAEEYDALVDSMAATQANLDEGLAPDNSWGFTLIAISRNAEHRGDCTKESFSCLRCGYIGMTNNAIAALAVIAETAKGWPTETMSQAMIRRGSLAPHGDWHVMFAASPLVKPEPASEPKP